MMRFLAGTMALLLATASLAAPPDKAAVKRVRSAAADYEKEGFKLREDFWGGAAVGGERQVVKHQLFRGNEYWFWLGAGTAEARVDIKVYDEKGRPVDVETQGGGGWGAARVLPPRTGSYTIVFVFEKSETGKDFPWAMTYGYR